MIAFMFSIEIALKGHEFIQAPQPKHRCSSTVAIRIEDLNVLGGLETDDSFLLIMFPQLGQTVSVHLIPR